LVKGQNQFFGFFENCWSRVYIYPNLTHANSGFQNVKTSPTLVNLFIPVFMPVFEVSISKYQQCNIIL
jgi:hypothetical protein